LNHATLAWHTGERTVSGDRILQISKGRLRPLFARPDFSTTSVPWGGFLIEECINDIEEKSPSSLQMPMVFVSTRDQCTAYWRYRGTSNYYNVQPGSICVSACHFEIESFWQSNPWHLLAVALDTSKLRHMAPLEAAAVETSRAPPLFTEDARVAALVREMHIEAKAGCPCGRLFGESLSLALLSHLAGNYAERCPTLDVNTRIPSVQKRRVLHFIRENLDMDIAVSDLAACIGVSSAHFSRTFRASFGMSPYRFVMQERVAKAKAVLEESRKTIGEIAVELGFPSHSHFTKIFHKMTGATPGQFRGGR
jgi:AraC family transcriptional regulator